MGAATAETRVPQELTLSQECLHTTAREWPLLATTREKTATTEPSAQPRIRNSELQEQAAIFQVKAQPHSAVRKAQEELLGLLRLVASY